MAPRRGHVAMPVPPQIVTVPPAYTLLFARAKRRFGRLFRSHAVTPAPPQAAAPTAFSSPSPELFTRSSNRDRTTSSRSQDLITRTRDHDLEA
jgi:hypothetical protein